MPIQQFPVQGIIPALSRPLCVRDPSVYHFQLADSVLLNILLAQWSAALFAIVSSICIVDMTAGCSPGLGSTSSLIPGCVHALLWPLYQSVY